MKQDPATEILRIEKRISKIAAVVRRESPEAAVRLENSTGLLMAAVGFLVDENFGVAVEKTLERLGGEDEENQEGQDS